jgi:threonine synthase
MGLPVERLIVATNENDILARTLATGRYEPRGVTPTTSPSMDIQVSSNFERLIYEVSGRDAGRVRDLMKDFTAKGAFELNADELGAIAKIFSAHRVDEAATARTIADVYRACGYLADPHTAVGLAAAIAELEQSPAPMIALATAHPAKFPDAVSRAVSYPAPVPERLQAILDGREDYLIIEPDIEAVRSVIHDRGRFAA